MPRQSRSASRFGFTLIELLVVIGIIVLLIGLLLTGLVHARKQAARTRTTADLALIGTALEAYKLDFGDYPRFPTAADDAAASNPTVVPGNGTWLDYRYNRGAVLLCRCLLGAGPAGIVTQSYANAGDDGAVGFGFRATRNVTTYGGTATDQFTGKVFGPYIQSDKFPLVTANSYTTSGFAPSDNNYSDTMLADSYGNPILYFPALPTHGDLSATNAFVALANPSTIPAANPQPLYNAWDNSSFSTALSPTYLSLKDMQYILGDRNNDGAITSTTTPPEQPVTTIPYLLWTAGPDGIYGRGPDGKTDDVTNFDMPVDLAK